MMQPDIPMAAIMTTTASSKLNCFISVYLPFSRFLPNLGKCMLYANDKDTAGIIGQRGTPFQFGRELHACHSQSPFGHNLSHIIATIVAQVSASRRR
jgi:hypothetical protein